MHTQSILLRLMFSTHCCSGRNTAAPGDSTPQLLLSTILLQGSRQVLLATPLLLQVSTMLLMFSTLLILVCHPVIVPTWLLLFLTMLPDCCRCRCSCSEVLCLHLKNIEENIVSATFEEGQQIQQIIYVICPQLVLIDEVNVRNEKNMTV